jgi:hypothetical protein
MTKDKAFSTERALDLALEALELTWDSGMPHPNIMQVGKAITAIKQARSAPAQEPVAWGCNRYIEDDNGFQIGTDEPELAWGKYAPDDNGWWPLYTTPPAQRQWVGLTDEERVDLWKATETDNRMVLIDAIEAKLKEKNQ